MQITVRREFTPQDPRHASVLKAGGIVFFINDDTTGGFCTVFPTSFHEITYAMVEEFPWEASPLVIQRALHQVDLWRRGQLLDKCCIMVDASDEGLARVQQIRTAGMEVTTERLTIGFSAFQVEKAPLIQEGVQDGRDSASESPKQAAPQQSPPPSNAGGKRGRKSRKKVDGGGAPSPDTDTSGRGGQRVDGVPSGSEGGGGDISDGEKTGYIPFAGPPPNVRHGEGGEGDG